MIASHNSMSYLPAVCPLMHFGRAWWRCQRWPLQKQYEKGVRYFDMRVRWKDDAWQACHGLVDFRARWATLADLLRWLKDCYPEAVTRIVLERGDDERFRREIRALTEDGREKTLMMAVVKKKWEVLYLREDHPRVVDLDWHYSLRHLLTPIREYAKSHVPRFKPEQIAEKETVWFCDFVEYGLLEKGERRDEG